MKNMKKTLSLTLFSVSAIMSCFSPAANATVIDFEGYGAGTIIDNEYAADLSVSAVNNGRGRAVNNGRGRTVNNGRGRLGVAVIFDTTNPTGDDTDLGGPFNSNNSGLPDSYDPGNVLIIHEKNNCGADFCKKPDDEASGGIFYLDFTTAITLESIDFFDIEASENGHTSYNAIRLFDTADNEMMIDTFYIPVTGGDNTWDTLMFNVDGVKRIELNMAGSGAIDNVKYSARTPVPAAVWLFTSGFIGLTALARRKKA